VTVRGRSHRRALTAALALALASPLAAAPAAPERESGPLTRDEARRLAASGASAAQILRRSWPAATLRRDAGARRIRALVTDLAPQVVLSGRTPLTLTDEGAPGSAPRVIPEGHRYMVLPRGGGLTLRDLDDGRRTLALTGPVRIDAGTAATGVHMAEPLGRRYRGALRVGLNARGTIMVVNDVPLEDYLLGVLPGDMPAEWGRAAPTALVAGAVAVRSRALSRLTSRPTGFDATADDPLYLGIDGERGPTTRAVRASRGLSLTVSRRPFEASFPVAPGAAVAFLPEPGKPDPIAEAPGRPVPGARPGVGVRALDVALRQAGTPYRWGGAKPGGFDCSGLTYFAYAQQGVTLPRVADDQARAGWPVARDQLEPGDLVFFADSSGYVHHMGMYVGGGRMVHAPQTGDVVKLQDITTGYYARQYAGARRYSGPVGA
jgi:hypothetical protein